MDIRFFFYSIDRSVLYPFEMTSTGEKGGGEEKRDLLKLELKDESDYN